MADGTVLVQKYGGSSLATPTKIKAVAANVVRSVEQGHRLVVVVSAMGETTDHLLELAHEVNPHPSRRELDMLLSVGERISMALLSMAVTHLGHEAISFTGSQCGIMTDDNHFAARIIEVRPFRVQDELEQGKVVIVAGYQGTSYRRDVTTLGRGGSDTTAVALAAALGAEACEIYSDVDGGYSADPRIVEDARHIPELGYGEMAALARAGARVLNAQAVQLALDKGIAIFARAADTPAGRETVVRRNLPPLEPRVVGVTGRRDLLLLQGSAPGRAGTLFAQLSAQALALSWKLDGDRLEALLDPGESELKPPDGLTVVRGRSTVAVVGNGIDRSVPLTRRIVRLVEDGGLPIEAVQLSDSCCSLLLGQADPAPAVRLLHRELVENGAAQ